MASHERVDEEEAILEQASGSFSVALCPIKDDTNILMHQDQTLTEDALSQTETILNQSQKCHQEIKDGSEEVCDTPKEILLKGNEDRSGTEGEKDCYCEQIHGPMNSEHGCVQKCLNCNFTSVTEKTQPISSNEGQRDNIEQIVTNIEQGEQLLQQLQDLQLQQDLKIAQRSQCPSEVVRGEGGGIHSDIKAEGVAKTQEIQEGKEVAFDFDQNEKDMWMDRKEDKNIATSLEEPKLLTVSQEKNKDSFYDDNLCDGKCPVRATSPVGQCKADSPSPPPYLYHKLSVAETAIEKQVHLLAVQQTQNLQRVDGVPNLSNNLDVLEIPETVLKQVIPDQEAHNPQEVDSVSNLADNPDVLEIPFKTNIVFDTAPVVPPCSHQDQDWQFSEQKMQQEIHQDIQRELVLVNQGKIPGEYSKGEARQFKETKLLFEVAPQRGIEGPMRRKKNPTLTLRSPVYPTVIERTRSLEFFSLKSRPISKAQSLRFFRSNSEIGRNSQSRELSKTSFLLHLKEEEHMHLHKSTNAERANAATSENWKMCHSKNVQRSHIQSKNPFYKLRPALISMPEVEKDIREAKEREEELHRHRCALYGEYRQSSEDQKVFQYPSTVKSGKSVILWS